MEINGTPMSKQAEKMLTNHSFSLKAFTGIENILLEILEARNNENLNKKGLKKIMDKSLDDNKVNPKEMFHIYPEDIQIPRWLGRENMRKKILSCDVRKAGRTFKQELTDIRRDIQFQLFEAGDRNKTLSVPDMGAMNFFDGKKIYTFSEIEEYIRAHGFMYERGANRKIDPKWIKDVKIEYRESYFDKPCVVLKVFYEEPTPYRQETIPLIALSLPMDPNKTFPYITCFNEAVRAVVRGDKEHEKDRV